MIGTTSAQFGIVESEPESTYRTSGAVGNSMLSDFLKDERYFYRKHILRVITEEPTPDMRLGSLLHLYMESYEKYRATTLLKPPGCDRRKTEWKDWARKNAGRTVLSREDHVRVSRMAASIRHHPEAAQFRDGKAEVTIRLRCRRWGNLPVQVRLDRWCGAGVVDWKKTKDVDEWPRKIASYGYHRQAALYSHILAMASMEEPLPFTFCTVEDDEPYRVRWYRLSEDWLKRGWDEIDAGMIRLEERLRTGNWQMAKPGISTVEMKPWERSIA